MPTVYSHAYRHFRAFFSDLLSAERAAQGLRDNGYTATIEPEASRSDSAPDVPKAPQAQEPEPSNAK